MLRLLHWALISLIVLLPIPFGGVLPWTWAGMSLVIGAMITLWGLSAVFGVVRPWQPPAVLSIAGILFLLVVIWALLQTFSFWPVKFHHPLSQSAARVLSATDPGTISISPADSMESAVRMLAYGSLFWLALQVARDSRRAATLLYWICLAVGINALYGLISQLAGSRTILWYPKSFYADSLTGTFVNRNSFAAFTGLALLCVTGLLWQCIRRATEGVSVASERRRVLITQTLERHWPLLASWLVLAAALFATQSRGGVAASMIALFVLITLLSLRRPWSLRSLLVPTVILISAVLIMFQFGGERLDTRLHESRLTMEGRLKIYDATLLAIDDAAISGTGLNTFGSVFRFYSDGPVSTKGVARAHSDYLEMALELGLPTAIALFSSLLLIALNSAAGIFRRSRNLAFPCIGLSASILIGLQSTVDFSLQIPAVAAVFCIILGIATAQASSSRA